MLFNGYLAVSVGKTDYVEVGGHWGMMADEDITVSINSYEKIKIFKIFRLFIAKSKFLFKPITFILSNFIYEFEN